MKRKIEFTLVGLPKSLNGSHGSWHAKSAERRRWRNRAAAAAHPLRPDEPFKKCSLECVRFSARCMDFDNLVASFKSIVDGLKDAGVIVDDNPGVIVTREYRHEKSLLKDQRVLVRVTEIEGISL